MIMLQAMAVAVIMVMIVTMVVVIVAVAGFEKFRLDLEDAIEVERAALQHVRQRDLATLGAMQFGVRIDAANARLDLGKLGLGDEIGLVEHDDVGERDLVLGFRRILEPVAQPFRVGYGHHHDHDHGHSHGGLKHYHDEDMQSLSLRSDKPLDATKFMPWLQNLVASEGQKILRSKGILAFSDDDDRYVFQGVHMMLEGDHQRAWKDGEPRESRLVFIGRELPEQTIRDGFERCITT